MRRAVALLACAAAAFPVAAAAPGLEPFRALGDAIAGPLGGFSGDPGRGRVIVSGRDANCLLCHAVPDTGARFMGDIGPPLAGVAARLSGPQLRLRIVDSSLLNPETVMPSYYRTEGLVRVAPAFANRPVLSAQQIEDVVAFLQTLK